MAEAAKILSLPIVVSEQYPDGLGRTIEEIKIKLPADAIFFEKRSFSCCAENGFLDMIKNLKKSQFFVCGIESHICVHQTVYQLIKNGFEVHIAEDAISSRKEANFKLGISRMTSYGAVLSCVETGLFELLKCTRDLRFKQIQALIK